MKVLVISDIHANFDAFQAVVAAAAGKWQQCWFLGDLAGYGPDFQQCLRLLQQLQPTIWLAGNHDLALLNHLPLDDFIPHAGAALRKQQQINNANLLQEFADCVKLGSLTAAHGGCLVHGSPLDPVSHYQLSENDRFAALRALDFCPRFLAYGHSHRQEAFATSEGRRAMQKLPPHGGTVTGTGEVLFFNPGSVGQPRDYDPRACYAIFDPDSLLVKLERVSYPIEKVAAKMQEQQLPEFLHRRLWRGN